uniref:P53-induced death domain protein 1 n=1 Tax=Hucho hucho TaxID=62062 RepID=A0A4W5L6S6_9TELE
KQGSSPLSSRHLSPLSSPLLSSPLSSRYLSPLSSPLVTSLLFPLLSPLITSLLSSLLSSRLLSSLLLFPLLSPLVTSPLSSPLSGCLLSLRELLIHSNDLRVLPVSLGLDKREKLKVDIRNNPLGRPPTPPPLPPTPDQVETRIPEIHLGLNQHRFCVSSAGCHVFLPGGAELLFPSGCLATTTTLQWAERMPDRKWVWLEEHDFLLSRPLELLPHSIAFLKPVEVCVPYHRSRRGEVVVRRFDGQQWSTLSTETRRGSIGHSSHPGGRPARLACVSVGQFSWFVAVGRPVRDSCSVTPEGALLVSRTDAGIKLTFPPDCTVQTRTITLQVQSSIHH